MKQYKDLSIIQKKIFEKTELLFIQNININRKDFITVLGVLINKYKIKK